MVILTFSNLDHFPVLLYANWVNIDQGIKRLSSFEFERMWFSHPQFQSLLRQWWLSSPFYRGTKMFQFAKKLRHVKFHIQIWNKKVFKNIFSQKEEISKMLADINKEIIHQGLNSKSHHKQKGFQDEWEELCKREETYWRQKSRELSLKDGDKNTKYFHASKKQKRAQQTLYFPSLIWKMGRSLKM